MAATKLETARTIGGVAFDGTANIDLPGVNTAGNQSTTGNAATATKLATARTISGVSFDGTANITLTAADVGAAPSGYGLGSYGAFIPGNDLNTGLRTASGFYNASSAANRPAWPMAGAHTWDYVFNIAHNNPAGYNGMIAMDFFGKGLAFKTVEGGVDRGWKYVYHTGFKPTAADVGAMPASGGGIAGDFWRASDTNQYGLVDVLGSSADAKACLVLLAKKYVGTLLSKTGFVGRILFSRGAVSANHQTDYVDVNVSVAYSTNSARLLYRSGSTVGASKIVEVNHNNEVYYALYRSAYPSAEVSVTGTAFEATLPLLIPDASAYTITDVVTTEEDYHVGNKPTAAELAVVPDTRTVNGKRLNTDITITSEDVGAYNK